MTSTGFMTDDEIVPSSGFTARVMDAVHLEATTPPAIPFPWTRALPGIVAAAVALVATSASSRPAVLESNRLALRDGFEFNRRE